MNPRALAIWVGCLLAVAFLSTNPVYRAVLFLGALNVMATYHRPQTHVRPLLFVMATSAALAVVISLLTSHVGQHVIVSLPTWIPLVGGALTAESAVFGVASGLGIATALAGAACLSVVLEPHELVDALPHRLHRVGATVGVALNLVPTLGRSAGMIMEAQRMRGWTPHGPRSWSHIVVPSVTTSVEQSVTLAEAMEARAYGGTRRTSLSAVTFSWRDRLIMFVSVCALGLFAALRWYGLLDDWYPFPRLTPPSVNAIGIIGCLLFATPALLHSDR